MKYLKANNELCVGCRVCEETCSEMFFRNNAVENSRIRVNEKETGYEINVCNQCGKCIALCPAQALSVNSLGVVMLDKNECIGCLICVAECPSYCMHYTIKENNPFKCIACGACVKNCPAKALEIVKEN